MPSWELFSGVKKTAASHGLLRQGRESVLQAPSKHPLFTLRSLQLFFFFLFHPIFSPPGGGGGGSCVLVFFLVFVLEFLILFWKGLGLWVSRKRLNYL